jgi:hypothetical protein
MSNKKSDRSTRRKSTEKRLLSLHTKENVKLSYNDLRPVFSLRHMREKYSLEKCTSEQKQAFGCRMVELFQLKWSQIIMASRHGFGCEKVSPQSIKGDSIPIIPEITPDDTPLLALRFSNKHPMVGYREKDIFHILWFDRDYTLYAHGS